MTKEERYLARMARKKSVVDQQIATAQNERGILLINTGNGKGKSSAAFGLIPRTLGHGLKVAVVQFIKNRTDTGEETFFRQTPGVSWHICGEGFTWETQDTARDQATAEAAWSLALQYLNDASISLLILDEFTYCLKYGWLDTDAVLTAIQQRHPDQNLVITGRGAPEKLLELADTVTEMADIKHAFRAGVKAMPGMEW